MKGFLLFLLFAPLFLSGCCHGAWCYTPVQAGKKVGVPPPGPGQADDRSTNTDPRTMGPRDDPPDSR